MFAYLLIGIELTILFSVFWYVFIREPKPFRIGNAGLWGSYEAGSVRLSQPDIDTLVMEYKKNAHNQVLIDRRVPRFANPHMVPTYASDFRDPSLGSGMPLPVENGWNSLYGHSSKNRNGEYGWVADLDEKPGNPLVAMLAAALGWFENLSVKMP
ncbi:MAG TPA: hypothetical protein V6C89_15700 [Drouetiella sp.]